MKSVRLMAAAAALLVASVGVAAAQSDQMTGQHTMEGTVTSVSAKTGWVHVKTSEGTMITHFPQAALADVKKGDTISVDLSMKDNGPAKPKAAKTK